ncbi:MAG TPA: IS256 family transposase [Candidatus Babeliales bacterium]|nr:IS256 family transposase [Candidatus Babeliales bacterium]
MAKKNNLFDPKMLDELIKNVKTSEEVFGENGLMKQFKKAILERMLESELTTDLGYEKYDPKGKNSGNSRNGHTEKTLKTEDGELIIAIPRDRQGEFEPQIVPKHQTRFTGLDDKIISLYARGMTTRDIQMQLQEMYGVEVSPTLISNVTDEVIDEVKSWQSRPLDKVYPIVYLDALVIKVKEDKRVQNKAFYLALGVNIEGQKELLGIWISVNEGAKFWLNVLTELKNRGVEDILVACVDGLTGFPDAIAAVYPKAQVQLCIVHMIRNSLRYVGWKSRKVVAADLKAIYGAKTVEGAELALSAFSDKWDKEYPSISKSWYMHWENIIPFFAYPPDIRKVIYTTNAIESLNMTLRKVLKNKRAFPSDEAALKQLYLGIKNISKKWTMPVRNWKEAMNCFLIMFEKRLSEVI